MPSNPTQSSARLLAPAALLVFVLAVALVVLDSGGSDEASKGKTTTAGQRTATTDRAGTRRRRARATYTVKPGDTLGAIGQKTGVKVETLQLLNPSLDPQALVAGQKIKLH